MQINPAVIAAAYGLPTTTPSTTGSTPQILLPIPGGSTQAFAMGTLVNALVTQLRGRDAVLNVNGQAVIVKDAINLPVGTQLSLRVGGEPQQPTLEVLKQTPPDDPGPALPTAVPRVPAGVAPTRTPVLVVVDVQAKQPNGQFQVEIEGQPVVAQSPLPLQPGNRYTLTVARTAAGTIILDTPPPNTPAPQLTQGVVSAILRGLPPSPAPDFARRVQPLLQEIEELPITTPKVVVEAAAAVKKVVDGILPSEPRLLKAEELRTAIRDSGLQQEAKLAQMVEQGDKMVSPRSPVHHDLKTTLLALVESARAVKEIAPALPQALSTLNTIEAAQAVNALNQYQGGAYFVQVPFPEGEEWKTAHLAIEPEYGEDGADGSTSPQFRVLLNVTLTKLGEVWADVSMSDTGLSTVFYLNETSRVQFAEQKQALEAELQAEGFGKTWIDLRSSQDLPERLQKRGMAMKAGTPEFSGLFDFVV